jgi:hypothetical protein
MSERVPQSDVTSLPRLAGAVCESALADARFKELKQWLSQFGVPQSAGGWLQLLDRYLENQGERDRFKALSDRVPEEIRTKGVKLEHFAVLNALSAGVLLIKDKPLPPSVRNLYAALCIETANPTPRRLRGFEAGTALFTEIAQLAAFHRFPAGEVVFDVARLPKSWLLKIHPLDLYSAVAEIRRFGFGPYFSLHLNGWRDNTLIIQHEEKLRSLYRIAKTLELNTDDKGIMADSWFYSDVAGRMFPHLAWMRAFFRDERAYIVDLAMAPPESGFAVGSVKRRQLYSEGQFRPRRTLVLWARDDVLAWAARNPQFADTGETPVTRTASPAAGSKCKERPSRPARRRNILNSLWNGAGYLDQRPKKYILFTLLFPALAAALTGAVLIGAKAAIECELAVLAALWLFQYFCFL